MQHLSAFHDERGLVIESLDLTCEFREIEQARFDQGDECVDILQTSICLTTAKAAIDA